MRLFLVPLFVIVWLFGGAVAMANQPRIALVIGNSDYDDAPLANPVRDAALMAETLRDVGFEVLEYNDLNRRELTKAFIRLGRRLEDLGPSSTALVYYAGHGAQVNGENYLIPIGAEIEEEIDVEIEGVRASSLLGTLRNAKSALNIVILDACRNNPFESASRSATRGLAKMDAPTGTLLAYSTAPGKVAEDGSGNNSTYTKALARAIKTPGAKVEEVFKTVRVNVVDRTQGRQVPWESSSLTGDFIFKEKPPEPEPVVTASASAVDTTQIEIEYWKSIANSTNPALFQAYLNEYPQGLFSSIAEQRVASLNAAQAVPQVDEEFEREKAVWNSVKDSHNASMLRGFVETYPDSIYANIAKAMIDDIESKQQVASRAVHQTNEELLMWDSVKNARTAEELQVYLDAYPEGKYAKLAETKIAALNTAPVRTTTPDKPFDGQWRITGEPYDFRRSYRGGICENADSMDDVFTVTNGEVKAKVYSRLDGTLNIVGTMNPGGRVELKFQTGSGYGMRGKLVKHLQPNMKSTVLKVRLKSANASGCTYDFTVTRVE